MHLGKRDPKPGEAVQRQLGPKLAAPNLKQFATRGVGFWGSGEKFKGSGSNLQGGKSTKNNPLQFGGTVRLLSPDSVRTLVLLSLSPYPFFVRPAMV